MYKLFITELAHQDLDRIVSYIAVELLTPKADDKPTNSLLGFCLQPFFGSTKSGKSVIERTATV